MTLYDWCKKKGDFTLVHEWDAEGNPGLSPRYIGTASEYRARWRCPYCEGRKLLRGFNDLATKRPELAAEWFQPLNHDLTPDMVTPGSQKTVAWKCGCGCVWYARIDARARKNGTGCPACAGQLNRAKIAYYVRVEAEAPRRHLPASVGKYRARLRRRTRQ